MKKILFAGLLVTAFTAQAQEKFAPVKTISYGGFGAFLPSSDMKDNSMIDNGINFSVGHFQSVTKPYKLGTNGFFRLGLEARLIYSKFEKDLQPPASIRALRYDNGSGTPAALAINYETLKKKPDAFHYLLGPSALFGWNKFFLQPSVLFGYASVSQEQFRFYDVLHLTTDPAQDTPIDYYTAGHETNNGFVVVPGVKAGWRLHKSVAAFVSVDYSMGSKQEFEDKVYQPSGTPDGQGIYDFSEMAGGTLVPYARSGKLRALMVNVNLAFTIGK